MSVAESPRLHPSRRQNLYNLCATISLALHPLLLTLENFDKGVATTPLRGVYDLRSGAHQPHSLPSQLEAALGLRTDELLTDQDDELVKEPVA